MEEHEQKVFTGLITELLSPIGHECPSGGSPFEAHTVDFKTAVLPEKVGYDIAFEGMWIDSGPPANTPWLSIWVNIIENVDVNTVVSLRWIEAVGGNSFSFLFHDAQYLGWKLLSVVMIPAREL
jgi:hypothetical protein